MAARAVLSMAMETSSGQALLIEGEDYYLENGLMVLTAAYHLRRGYCCEQGCRHCPFGNSKQDQATKMHKNHKRERQND